MKNAERLSVERGRRANGVLHRLFSEDVKAVLF
jgi:hypothetical protein